MFNLIMKRLSVKNRKGFTLVELMIVIAIIGVLALVLIPQASKMRTNAKLAGVDSNIRLVQAQIETVIDDSNTFTEFTNSLESRLGDMITNPFTATTNVGHKDVDDETAADTVVGDFSVIINTTVLANKTAADAIFAVAGTSSFTSAPLAGTVIVVPLGSSASNVTGAAIYGFDEDGAPYTTDKKSREVSR